MNCKIILLTDSLPCANGGGISQTLYNLLDNWSAEIFFVGPANSSDSGVCLAATPIDYAFEKYKTLSNRIGKLVNKKIGQLNFQQQEKLVSLPPNFPCNKNCFVLVSTTEPIKLQFAWILQQKFGYTVVPYFMDDWMGNMQQSWKGNDIHRVVKELLQSGPCRIMISRNLDTILKKRYQLTNKPTLIIHNPAPVVNPRSDNFNVGGNSVKLPDSDKSKITNHKSQILYAGSIWPMHLDALVAVAKAVGVLHAAGKTGYQLTIYTSEAAWLHNRAVLEGPGVIYGGFIPYPEMPAKLAKASLLLVTASFDEKYAPFTNSSVQTKLTDYMAAGKPLLYVGPETGASGQFVHEWDCGFTIGMPNPGDIAAQLEAIAASPGLCAKKATNGLQAAATHFSKPIVQQKLYQFFAQHVQPDKLNA